MSVVQEFGLLAILQGALNGMLANDEYARRELATLAGKVIALELMNTQFRCYLNIDIGEVTWFEEPPAEVNVTIRLWPQELFMLFAENDTERGQSGTMEIIGEVNTAQRFQGIIADLRPDWEEKLSLWIGDISTHQISRLARSGKHFMRNGWQKLKDDSSEYLRFEVEEVPIRLETERFAAELNDLRDGVERLVVRVARLSQRISDQT